MDKFGEFYKKWQDAIGVVNDHDTLRAFYFQTDRDEDGFDLLPDFFRAHREEWAVMVAAQFEKSSGLAAKLDGVGLSKFRMITDRHMVNLTKGLFDTSYYKSSDERSLFLIYHEIAPVQICSSLTRAKNASIDMVIAKSGGKFGYQELALISAISTLFVIELHNIMRAYLYFDRANPEKLERFKLGSPETVMPIEGYVAQTSNCQMTMPDKAKTGSIELF